MYAFYNVDGASNLGNSEEMKQSVVMSIYTLTKGTDKSISNKNVSLKSVN